VADVEQIDNKYLPSDLRSLEMHRLIATTLEADPSLIERARSNISHWKNQRWEEILSSGMDRILHVLTSEDQASARLGSSTPFTGILSDAERKMIHTHWSNG